jgi:N-formylglutamate amidohydrolase
VFFSVREPEGDETPVVVEVPHAGLAVDPLSLSTLVAPARSLGRDADLYVDELYADAPSLGATLLSARISRYVCDLNRGEGDVDALTVEGGMARPTPHGLVWRTTTESAPAIAGPLPRRELERRLSEIYRPYHATLRRLLDQKLQRFGIVVLLCGHSMPSRGRAGHTDPGRERADVVPGSRGRTSALPEVIELPATIAREIGWSVAHDDPYKGGFSTGHYGRPTDGVHAVQVELARRLYMDELSLHKKPNEFERTRDFCRTLVARMGRLGLALGAAVRS